MIYNKAMEMKDYEELEPLVDSLRKLHTLYGPLMLVSVEHRYWEYAIIHKFIVENIPIGSRLLEFGSAAAPGQGTPLSPSLAMLGYNVVCTDVVEHGGEAVNRQNEVFGINMEWALEDACSLTFPDESFECVFSISVIEHIPYDMQAIEQCLRVLKPGGFLTFTCDFSNLQTRVLPGQVRLYTNDYITNTLFPFAKNLGAEPFGEVDFSTDEQNVWYDGLNYNFAIVTLRKS